MTYPRLTVSLAVILGLGAIVPSASAKERPSPAANQRLHALVSARQVEGLSPDLGYGSIPLPLPKGQVQRFTFNHYRQGEVPPPIPAILRGTLSPALVQEVEYRRAFALEYFREQALRRPSHIAGGIYFPPPLGTPFLPVRPINAFDYLPVFRITLSGEQALARETTRAEAVQARAAAVEARATAAQARATAARATAVRRQVNHR